MLRNTVIRATATKRAVRSYASEALEQHIAGGPCFGLSDDQRAFQELTRDFTAKEIIPVAAHYDRTMEYPWDVIKKAHAAGLVNSAFLSSLRSSHLSSRCNPILTLRFFLFPLALSVLPQSMFLRSTVVLLCHSCRVRWYQRS